MKAKAIHRTLCAALALGLATGAATAQNPGQPGPPRAAPPFASQPLAKSDREKEVLALLKEMSETQRRGSMSVPEDDGRILRMLVESLGAKEVVEIGTSVGYSGHGPPKEGRNMSAPADEGPIGSPRGHFIVLPSSQRTRFAAP